MNETTSQRGKFLNTKFKKLYFDGENDQKLNPKEIGDIYKEHYWHESERKLSDCEVTFLLVQSCYLPQSVLDQ